MRLFSLPVVLPLGGGGLSFNSIAVTGGITATGMVARVEKVKSKEEKN